jgi:hypothetical protein
MQKRLVRGSHVITDAESEREDATPLALKTEEVATSQCIQQPPEARKGGETDFPWHFQKEPALLTP